MSLKTWLQANRNDERDDMIVARAAMWGFNAMSLGSAALGIAWMVTGRVTDAMTIVLVLSLGQVVFAVSLLRMRTVR